MHPHTEETIFNPELLEEKFSLLKDCFLNMPLDAKTRKEWLDKKRREKIFALIVINNPGLRENAVKNYLQICRDKSYSMGREAQSFDTLLNNIESFKSESNKSFYDCLTFGRKINQNTTPDLFSLLTSNSKIEKEDSSDLENIKEICETANHQKEGSIQEICKHAVELYKELSKCNGLKKYSCLFPDFIISKNEIAQLFNFPLAILIAHEETKEQFKKSYPGKRFTDIKPEDIPFAKILKALLQVLELSLKQLKQHYKTYCNFEKLEIDKKIRVNYLMDKGFAFPTNVQEKGFDLKKGVFKALTERGEVSLKDSDIEVNLLALELLELEGFVHRIIKEGDIQYIVNIETNQKSRWEKLNKMPKTNKSNPFRVLTSLKDKEEGKTIESKVPMSA